jgi:hypothetical protein
MVSADLTRADFSGAPARILRRGSSYKADLLLYDVAGECVLLKDYSRKRGVWRDVLGIMFTAREARALRALDGVEGVPQFRGRPDSHSIAMTFVAGRRIRTTDPDLRSNEEFIRRLRCVVRGMHERGIVHLDLKHRSNLIVTADGGPVILDFESALCFDPGWFGGRLAVGVLGQFDWLAVQNWTRRLCPRMLDGSPLGKGQASLAAGTKHWWLPRRFLDALLEIVADRDSRGRPAG